MTSVHCTTPPTICPKSGQHRYPYQATLCRLYHEYYASKPYVRQRKSVEALQRNATPLYLWPIKSLRRTATLRGLNVKGLSKRRLLEVLS